MTWARLAAFGVGLAGVFAAAVVLGGLVGPVGEPAATPHGTTHDPGVDEAGHGEAHPDGPGDHSVAGAAAAQPGGLQISEGGYTLVPAQAVVPAGDRTVEFRIEGPDGEAVQDYRIEHEKELHVIAVRRDLTGFQHVHPERANDGTWSTRVDLTGGTWRLFADFTPTPSQGGQPRPLTLGTDLTVTGVGGRLAPAGSAPRRVDTVDGYRVEVTGALAAGQENDLTFAVTRRGKPVADLQPYLGARGHLVALREGDLAYLHVHPTDPPGATGHEVGFAATAPSVGSYRLYLDFRVGGVVRTASFVLPAASDGHGEDAHTH